LARQESLRSSRPTRSGARFEVGGLRLDH
jgi:hypothetical protein